MLRAWDPEGLLAVISRDGALSVVLVSTHAHMLRALGDDTWQWQKYDLSSLDALYVNAAALPVVLKEWVLVRFPGVGVHELSGSTEAGVVSRRGTPRSVWSWISPTRRSCRTRLNPARRAQRRTPERTPGRVRW